MTWMVTFILPIIIPYVYLPSKIDVKFEEFYDFFCTDLSNKTKNNFYEIYNKIKGNEE